MFDTGWTNLSILTTGGFSSLVKNWSLSMDARIGHSLLHGAETLEFVRPMSHLEK